MTDTTFPLPASTDWRSLASEQSDFVHGGPPPMAHQRAAFRMSRSAPAFALLMEQGTGKSKIVIDTATWLFQQNRIDRVLVIAPNGVKTNWQTEELPMHSHADRSKWDVAVWYAAPTKEQAAAIARIQTRTTGVLQWFVMNVEAIATPRAAKAATQFLKDCHGRAIVVIDESSRIKTPYGVQRTRAAIALGKLAAYRRICSGTSVTQQGPLDLYSQFCFLDPAIFGFTSFFTFRNRYAVMGGFNGKEVQRYQHVDELWTKMRPYSFRVTRDECLDLPPKMYQRITVDLNPEQRRLYDEMAKQMVATLGTETTSAPIILTQMLRLQQITGGFLPTDPTLDDGVLDAAIDRPFAAAATGMAKTLRTIPGENPKLAALLDLLTRVDGKVIVWARFRAELDAIAQALAERYGKDSVVQFHGGIPDAARTVARQLFQEHPGTRFFVGQPRTGGLGITLTAASTVVYYSNDFSLEVRLQSEDRAHRIGQTKPVLYVDLVAADTLDTKVLTALREKRDIAQLVYHEPITEWL